jgi:hypothetical protein
MPWDQDERVLVCNLTLPSGERDELIAKLKGFTQTLDAKRPASHASLAIECSPEGRWHAHGVVVTSRSDNSVRDVWRKQWPNGSRPDLRGQKVTSLHEGCSAVCDVRDLRLCVAYALKDIASFGWAEPDQIVSSGLLSGRWRARLAAAGLAEPVSDAAVLRHPRSGKAVAGSSAPSGDNHAPGRSLPASSVARRITPGKQCRWCAAPISLRRRDAVTCKPGCATSCRRALLKAVVDLSQGERDAFKRLVDVLEADYRLMRRNANRRSVGVAVDGRPGHGAPHEAHATCTARVRRLRSERWRPGRLDHLRASRLLGPTSPHVAAPIEDYPMSRSPRHGAAPGGRRVPDAEVHRRFVRCEELLAEGQSRGAIVCSGGLSDAIRLVPGHARRGDIKTPPPQS